MSKFKGHFRYFIFYTIFNIITQQQQLIQYPIHQKYLQKCSSTYICSKRQLITVIGQQQGSGKYRCQIQRFSICTSSSFIMQNNEFIDRFLVLPMGKKEFRTQPQICRLLQTHRLRNPNFLRDVFLRFVFQYNQTLQKKFCFDIVVIWGNVCSNNAVSGPSQIQIFWCIPVNLDAIMHGQWFFP